MQAVLRLNNRLARILTMGVFLGGCVFLVYLVLRDFLINALTDDRITISTAASASSLLTAPFTDDKIGVHPDILSAAARHFPVSPQLHLRLAESKIDAGEDASGDAEFHAREVIRLSPRDYRPHLLLASIRDSKGDFAAAEQAARDALQLAPANPDVHWKLGVLLSRDDKLEESLEHFRIASAGTRPYFESAMQLVWDASDEDVEAMRAITPHDAKDRLLLARFLLEHDYPFESAAVFGEIDRAAVLGNPESGRYLDLLIKDGDTDVAYDLWHALLASDGDDSSVLWNGGFESGIRVDFAQFDWSIHASGYARISLDDRVAHTGKRSLRIDFAGRETTKLGEEIRQLAMVRPGGRYRLRYFIKTQDLNAPEGIRVVVSGIDTKNAIAASEPAPMGSNGWLERTVEFVAPDPDLVIGIKQEPKFSYEEATHGTVWLDDFEIRELLAN